MTNWKEENYPFNDFNEEITELWKLSGFEKITTKKWLEVGLKKFDYELAKWLVEKKNIAPETFLEKYNYDSLNEEWFKSTFTINYFQARAKALFLKEYKKYFLYSLDELTNLLINKAREIVEEEDNKKILTTLTETKWEDIIAWHKKIWEEVKKRLEIDVLLTIFTGGQIGVDRAALLAAEKFSFCIIEGWCTRGRKAEDKRIDDKYPLMETLSEEYKERTEWNIRDSDGTLVLVIAPVIKDSGTGRTINFAEECKKPLKIVCLKEDSERNTEEVIEWIIKKKIKSLNVAGPREDHTNGIQEKSRIFLINLLEKIGEERNKIEKSRNVELQFQIKQNYF